MDFIIDTKGQSDFEERDCLVQSDDDDDIDFEDIGLDPSKIVIRKKEGKLKKNKADSNDADLAVFERDMGWTKSTSKSNFDSQIKMMQTDESPISKVLKKSRVKSGFERLKRAPKYDTNDKKLKLLRKHRRDKTKGSKWYNLPATEMTEEIKHDLEVIQMRSVLDPKHFYKKNDIKVLPKYFHIGKVVDSPLDYYNGRLTKKERKRTIVDELMADAEFSKYNKRKYKEIIEEKSKTHYRAHQRAKKLKRKKQN